MKCKIYSLYIRLGYTNTEIKIGEYRNSKLANKMLDDAVKTFGYAKLIHTTKKGIEVIKIKRRAYRYR